MAMQVGDILQFTDTQVFLGQQMLNVYHYRVDLVEANVTYADVINEFEGTVVQAVRGVQHSTCTHTGMIVRNLTNGLDIFEEAISQAGSISVGGPAPSFESLGYRLLRATALTRHGSKRVGGLYDTLSEGNNIKADQMVAVNLVATRLAEDLVVDAGGGFDFTLAPVIVGRFPVGDPNAGELDLSRINDVAGAQFVRLTTQTTRRAGRGA